MKVTAVIAAGGEGKRMGGQKQFVEISGVPMLELTLGAFNDCDAIEDIILVVPRPDMARAKMLVDQHGFKKVIEIVASGPHRQQSVMHGLAAVKDDSDRVLIHDGARPLVTNELIKMVVSELKDNDAVIPAVPVVDTVKRVDEAGKVFETLDREKLWAAQTPQGFKSHLIKEAHERAQKLGYQATDDARLVERLGHKVKVIMGSYENIKITNPVDVEIAESILKRRSNQ